MEDEFVIEEDSLAAKVGAVNINGAESINSNELINGAELITINGGAPVSRLNDKLKAIRPFTESQLMALYSNEELETYPDYVDRFLTVSLFFVTLSTKN